MHRAAPEDRGSSRWRRAFGRALLIGLAAFANALAARAAIDLEVEPTIATVGEPVLVFGATDCETYTVNVGDGAPAANFDGPSTFSLTHAYTQPGVYQVLVLGTACADGIDSQVSTVVVNPGGGPPPPSPPPGPPLPPSGNPLGTLFIERLNLRFENARPETRFLQNEKGARVFAEIQYTGTGLLQGYWEVDGAVWSFVNRHLVFGSAMTIASPELPGLPTIDPGVHRVRLVLTRPAAGFSPPLALYFVGYEDAPVYLQLELMRPAAGAHLGDGREEFAWAASLDVDHFAVRFFDAESRALVFTAFARTTGYELLERVLAGRFAPGRRYEWQVEALDAAGEEVARSRRRAFALDIVAEQSARQAVVATPWSPRAARTIDRLTSKLIERRAVASGAERTTTGDEP